MGVDHAFLVRQAGYERGGLHNRHGNSRRVKVCGRRNDNEILIAFLTAVAGIIRRGPLSLQFLAVNFDRLPSAPGRELGGSR